MLTLSIILEAVVALVFVYAAVARGKSYAWGLALTFAIYVFYDLKRLIGFDITPSLLDLLFLAATTSALWAALKILKK